MKKVLVCLMLVLVVGLVACGDNNLEPHNPYDDENNTPEVGDTSTKIASISLEGNYTTGYSWSYKIGDPDIVALNSENYMTTAIDEEIVGAGGVQLYDFKPLAKGTTNIIFDYSRSWETDVEPIYTLTYTVTVDENLDITVGTGTGSYSSEVIPEFLIY